MPSAQNRRIFTAVLAAGQSQRFGAPKLLQTIGEESLVHRAARLARSFSGDNSLLVAGDNAGDVMRAADDECQFVVINNRFAEGIGTSIAAAAHAVAHTADALVLLLADQPLITRDHLDALVSAWSGADNDIMVTAFAGAQGPPVLFPRGALPALCQMEGDEGARALLKDPAFNVSTVWFDGAAVDVDTPDDLSRLQRGDARE